MARAKAGCEAAEQGAARNKVLAKAQAREITEINNAIERNPAYIQLQSLEALKAILKDPAQQGVLHGRFEPEPVAADTPRRAAEKLRTGLDRVIIPITAGAG